MVTVRPHACMAREHAARPPYAIFCRPGLGRASEDWYRGCRTPQAVRIAETLELELEALERTHRHVCEVREPRWERCAIGSGSLHGTVPGSTRA